MEESGRGNETMTCISIKQNIERETEKAILVDIGDRRVWVPKSIISIDEAGVIFAPFWFAKKNGISFYGQRSVRV